MRAARPKVSSWRCRWPAVEARIVELSWFGDPDGAAAARRRLPRQTPDDRVVSGGPRRTIAATRDGTTAAAWQLVLDLLRDPHLDVLITGESEFEDAAGRDGDARADAGRHAVPPDSILIDWGRPGLIVRGHSTSWPFTRRVSSKTEPRPHWSGGNARCTASRCATT